MLSSLRAMLLFIVGKLPTTALKLITQRYNFHALTRGDEKGESLGLLRVKRE